MEDKLKIRILAATDQHLIEASVGCYSEDNRIKMVRDQMIQAVRESIDQFIIREAVEELNLRNNKSKP